MFWLNRAILLETPVGYPEWGLHIKTKENNARDIAHAGSRATQRKFASAFIAVIVLFSCLGTFKEAHASFFSSLSDFFAPLSSAVSESPSITAFSASKTPALRAAVNVDPNPAKGGGDITIVGGVALVPETGPEGTLADIQDQKPHSNQISIYVVREGDSLSEIAGMFHVSPNTILWANNLTNAKSVRPGDTLVILPVTGVEHVVLKGETLASIVKKYKGDMQEVLDFNSLSAGAKLAVGDSIVIPDGVDAPLVAKSSGSSSAGNSKLISGAGGPVVEGYYLRPLIGGRKSQGLHGYNGVDISTPVGTSIMASCPGTVLVSRDSGWNGGYGDYIVIQCSNGTQTVYGHLSKTEVSAGASVVQGQVIGLSGNTGRSTGAHLHFEIRGASNPF